MPRPDQLPYWIVTAQCPKHGELRAALAVSSIRETTVCGRCDTKLAVTRSGARAAHGFPWTFVKDDHAAASHAKTEKDRAERKATKVKAKPAPAAEPQERTLRCVRCKAEFKHVPNPHGGRMPFYCPGCRQPGNAQIPKHPAEPNVKALTEATSQKPAPVPDAKAVVTKEAVADLANRFERQVAAAPKPRGQLTFSTKVERENPPITIRLDVDVDVFAMTQEGLDALLQGIERVQRAVRG